jgi:hypothetical protein
MSSAVFEKLIQEELRGIPEDRLREVYDIIHYYRRGIEKDRLEEMKDLRVAAEKKFAEVWKEERDDVWESYI